MKILLKINLILGGLFSLCFTLNYKLLYLIKNIVALRKEGGIEGRIETVTKVWKVGQLMEE